MTRGSATLLEASDGKSTRAFSPVSAEKFRIILLLAPLVALLSWAFFLPIGSLLATSITDPFPNFANYAKLFGSELYVTVLIRTALIALAVTAGSLIIGFPIALLMARTGTLLSKLAMICVMVPLWTSVLVRSYAWIVLLDRGGIINSILLDLRLIEVPLKMLYTNGTVILAMMHVLLPFMILPIYSSLRSLPSELPLAAENMGAKRWQVFTLVVLPLCMPGVFAGCLIVFVMSLGFYITPALLGGPQTLMIATLIGQQAMELLDWPFAGAISFALLALSLGVTFIFRKLVRLDKAVAND